MLIGFSTQEANWKLRYPRLSSYFRNHVRSQSAMHTRSKSFKLRERAYTTRRQSAIRQTTGECSQVTVLPNSPDTGNTAAPLL